MTTEARDLRLVFFGTPEFAAVSLRRLLADGFTVVAVVTRADAPRGRGKKLVPCEVKALAVEHGIEVLDPRTPRDPQFQRRLAELAPDLGVVIAYGRILPTDVLRIPRLGLINAHGSLLPHLRGAAPIERAIARGDRETGVTIMRVIEEMDAGDMLMAERVPIDEEITGGALRARLAELSADLLVRAVEEIAAGRDRWTAQDPALVTFAPPLEKAEAAIDWHADAVSLRDRIRAFNPAPGAFTFDDGRRLKVHASRVVNEGDSSNDIPPGTIVAAGDDGIVVVCGRGRLSLLTVQPEGKRTMDASEYLRGLRDSPVSRRLGHHE